MAYLGGKGARAPGATFRGRKNRRSKTKKKNKKKEEGKEKTNLRRRAKWRAHRGGGHAIGHLFGGNHPSRGYLSSSGNRCMIWITILVIGTFIV